MGYMVMAHISIAHTVRYIVMAHIVIAHIVMGYIVMAHISIAHTVMAHIVMAHLAMAHIDVTHSCLHIETTSTHMQIAILTPGSSFRLAMCSDACENARAPIETATSINWRMKSLRLSNHKPEP